ncbi:hypothetical protein [Anaerosinus massiliensis]|nr:hypothetical protein [Massilibacillus massiliensis]
MWKVYRCNNQIKQSTVNGYEVEANKLHMDDAAKGLIARPA